MYHRNTPPLLVGFQGCTTTLDISLASPQKIGHSTTRRSRNSSPGHISRRCSNGNKDICSTMFIVAFFIIARSWKEPRCSYNLWPLFSINFITCIYCIIYIYITKHNLHSLYNVTYICVYIFVCVCVSGLTIWNNITNYCDFSM